MKDLRRINFVVPTFHDSFYLSAVYYAKWIDPSRFIISISTLPKPFHLNIRLNDMWNEFRRPTKADVYILDTPQYYNDLYDRVPLQRLRPKHVFVTSTWNQDMARDYFNGVEVVPRLVHPIYLSYPFNPTNKEYDLAFVGGTHPRKAFKEFLKVCDELKLRCWYTGSYRAYDLYTLVDKLSKTRFLWWLSKSEGFGLPVLEALSAGKPVVHADYKPLSEITSRDTSFRVKVYDVVYKRELGSIEYELHYYDPNEFAEAIIYAKDQVLRNRDEFREKCLERARIFDARKTYKVFVDMYYHGGLDYV